MHSITASAWRLDTTRTASTSLVSHVTCPDVTVCDGCGHARVCVSFPPCVCGYLPGCVCERLRVPTELITDHPVVCYRLPVNDSETRAGVPASHHACVLVVGPVAIYKMRFRGT